VSNNDINRVVALLDHKHDPLGLPHDPYGSLPNAKKSSLALVAYSGREEIMLLFLQRGFAWAINQLIGTDLPPLIAAAYAGHMKILHLLSWRADARLQALLFSGLLPAVMPTSCTISFRPQPPLETTSTPQTPKASPH